MKNLTLINNVWKVRKSPNITEEEKNILNNENVNSELLKLTLDNIKNRSTEDASQEESSLAQNIYDQNKLHDATLISVDISLPDGHGIINCRVNNEHKQIRF